VRRDRSFVSSLAAAHDNSRLPLASVKASSMSRVDSPRI
jgi:hypothetical protein